MKNLNKHPKVIELSATVLFYFFKSSSLHKIVSKLYELSRLSQTAHQINSNVKIFTNREKLWIFARKELIGRKVLLLEFGVAEGYATNWWFKNLNARAHIEYHGFDTFEGLPRSWNGFPKGSFTNFGNLPDLNLPLNYTFHKGLVQNTFNSKLIESMQHSAKKFVIFDFDLYEPTFFVFTAIKEYLNHGDLIYFDEANNDDEYRIIKESFENSQDFKLVGASFSCLLFRFEPKKIFFATQ